MKDNHANVLYFKDRFNEEMKPHGIRLKPNGDHLSAYKGETCIGNFDTIGEAWRWSQGFLSGREEGYYVGYEYREEEVKTFYPGYRNLSALLSALHGLIAWADEKWGETEPGLNDEEPAIITHSKAVAKEVQDAVDAQQKLKPESHSVLTPEEDASDDGRGGEGYNPLTNARTI